MFHSSAFVVALAFATIVGSQVIHSQNDLTQILGNEPTYCIDPNVLSIVNKRLKSCFFGTSSGPQELQDAAIHAAVSTELEILRRYDPASFAHAHELVAYRYYTMQPQRSERRECDDQSAQFEYIPLLPLSWRSNYPNPDTKCTAAGMCTVTDTSQCKVEQLVENILEVQAYLRKRRFSTPQSDVQKFTVVGTHNLKTFIGFGLPSVSRSGDIYNTVTAFIESLYLGHYERMTQCADVLRKAFKHTVEMPFLISHDANSAGAGDVGSGARSASFFFVGDLHLWGPGRVCSARTALYTVAPRSDVTVIDAPENSYAFAGSNQTQSATLSKLFRSSRFCLIARGNTHTSSFFYKALFSSCIPVVISDLFTFAYKWVIPYNQFVIRVAEQDFIQSPNTVLDHLLATYSADNIDNMKRIMKEYEGYWRYMLLSDGSASNPDPDRLQLPLKLMLVEMSKARNEAQEINALAAMDISTGKGKGRDRGFAVGIVSASCKTISSYCQSTIADSSSSSIEQTGGINSIGPVLCMAHSPQCVGNSVLSLYHGNIDIPIHIPGISPSQQSAVDGNVMFTKSITAAPPPPLCSPGNTAAVIGFYKPVFFMQCIRVLWPLKPGAMRGSIQSTLTEAEFAFILRFHGINDSRSDNAVSSDPDPDPEETYPPPLPDQLQAVLRLHAEST